MNVYDGDGRKTPEYIKRKTKEKIPRLVALPFGTQTDLVLELLPYMVDGLAHYVRKVGDTQQFNP